MELVPKFLRFFRKFSSTSADSTLSIMKLPHGPLTVLDPALPRGHVLPHVTATPRSSATPHGRVTFSESTTRPSSSSKIPDSPCTICDCTFSIEQEGFHTITSTCSHVRDVCTSCVKQHITCQSQVTGWDTISCPSCNASFEFKDIKIWASPLDFERYNSAQLRKALRADDSFIACAYDDCDATATGGILSGVIADLDADPWVTCNICERRTCVTCRTKYHCGMSCKESRVAAKERLQDDGGSNDDSDSSSLSGGVTLSPHGKEKAVMNLKESYYDFESDEDKENIDPLQGKQRAKRSKQKKKEETLTDLHFEEHKTTIYKKCPNEACGVKIMRDYGCEHMKCEYCV